MPRYAVLLFDGFSNFVLSSLIEPLRAVHDHGYPDLSWCVVTPDDGPVRSSSGLRVLPDIALADLGAPDALLVVAGYGFRDHAAGRTGALLRRVARRGTRLIGADCGSWLIAQAGLLQGHAATLHWSVLADFAETFPDVLVSHQRYVLDGPVWSSGGAASSLDMMLALVGRLFGPAAAFAATSMFLHDAARKQAGSRIGLGIGSRGSQKLQQAIRVMAENVETPLSQPELAASIGTSRRSLSRMFQSEIGMGPGRYAQMLRLARARELASSTDLSLQEIALRCGYSDAAALEKAFRRTYGQPLRRWVGRRPKSSGG
ncbi:GlxA family transcriptional regulator [Paracoccus sp. Z330]|uniref:GlxA family transcriptional regulator n=1 Tax=Paracoccus onchidii TaxID=3017813 RepID=A0ABT4ZKM5_9RHOB|nr:GlxA family transcriptional regulator [Paracoccus onchidii]MDB6179280.1 GlxA family transcriptional regulator [Paracoccus onchidii]